MSNNLKNLFQNHKKLVIFGSIIILALITILVIFLVRDQESAVGQIGTVNQAPLVSTAEAGIRPISPEAQEFLDGVGSTSQGGFQAAPIGNQFGDLRYGLVGLENNEQAVLVTLPEGNSNLIPIYNVIAATGVLDNKILITTGKYPQLDLGLDTVDRGREDGFNPEAKEEGKSLEGDIKAYIYDISSQESKLIYNQELEGDMVTDIFPIVRNEKVVMNFGNRVDLYSLDGEFISNLYTAGDLQTRMVVLSQEGLADNQYRVIDDGDEVILDI